jgi:hypothetical protein
VTIEAYPQPKGRKARTMPTAPDYFARAESREYSAKKSGIELDSDVSGSQHLFLGTKYNVVGNCMEQTISFFLRTAISD